MHLPVLLKEAINYLALKPGQVVLDATLGGGGHAREILNRIMPDGRLIALDRDPAAIERNMPLVSGAPGNVIIVNEDFRRIDHVMDKEGLEYLDGAIFDLGVSSFQLDEGERGFSFLRNGPLDMRFDTSKGVSAREVVNKGGREELTEIIRKYGEERHASLVARAICESRKKEDITTTVQLAGIVREAVGWKYRSQKLHPATRTFQAIRIYVNDELAAFEEGLNKVFHRMRPGARIAVISFHSLEDRITKLFFRKMAGEERMSVLTKKPVSPGDAERISNPRARSARLRAAEKI